MKSGITIVTSIDEGTVEKETKFRSLNERGFIRASTAEEQWMLFVNEAWKTTRLPMRETMRDYLSWTLFRLMARSDIVDLLSAFSYYCYVLEAERVDPECFWSVADMSLLYVSLFPGRSEYRHEPRTVQYTAELGETLYGQLAEDAKERGHCFRDAFVEMAEHFGMAVTVLRSARLPFRGVRLAQRNEFPTDRDARKVASLFLLHTEEPAGS